MAANAFTDDCKDVASGLRRLPKELRRALAQEAKREVAEPLAAKIRRAASSSGVYGRHIAATTKARAAADPKIVIGGASPKLAGGGRPTDVVFGVEWGGGRRRSPVLAHERGGGKRKRHQVRGYSRASTAQFRSRHHAYAYPTIEANWLDALDAYSGIVMKVLDQEVAH